MYKCITFINILSLVIIDYFLVHWRTCGKIEWNLAQYAKHSAINSTIYIHTCLFYLHVISMSMAKTIKSKRYYKFFMSYNIS